MSKVLIEFDSSGQEMRLMADISQDPNMCQIFRNDPPYDDAHGFTGSKLAKPVMSFEEFIQRKLAKDPEVTGPRGLRYQGKFTNLSCQYRISPKGLRIKVRIDYDMIISLQEAERIINTYLQTYPGVRTYWRNSIALAKAQGFSETLAGSRYYINRWSKKDIWGSESSAINHRIQGTGADMKYLAIAMIRRYFKKFWITTRKPKFRKDLHDGIFFVTELTRETEKLVRSARNMLGELPYNKLWGWQPSIPFPWDAAMGPHWGALEELKK